MSTNLWGEIQSTAQDYYASSKAWYTAYTQPHEIWYGVVAFFAVIAAWYILKLLLASPKTRQKLCRSKATAQGIQQLSMVPVTALLVTLAMSGTDMPDDLMMRVAGASTSAWLMASLYVRKLAGTQAG